MRPAWYLEVFFNSFSVSTLRSSFFYYTFILFYFCFLEVWWNKYLSFQLKTDTLEEIIYLHKIKKAFTYFMEHSPEAFKVVTFFFCSFLFWWNVISARNAFINYLFKGQALFHQNVYFAYVTSFTQKGIARRMMCIYAVIFFPAACQYTWML